MFTIQHPIILAPMGGGPGTPEGATGYMAARIAAGTNLNHVPNPNFLRIRADNTLFDHAAIFGLPAPFSAGQFHWRRSDSW